MLYGLLLALYALTGFLLIVLIFIQKGKGSLGLGNIGGGTQMLFGGSGGQDLFQKATWVLGALFMAGSLILALMKASSLQSSKYLSGTRPAVAQQHPQVDMPVEPTQEMPIETNPA